MIVQQTTPYIRAGRRIVNPRSLKKLVEFSLRILQYDFQNNRLLYRLRTYARDSLSFDEPNLIIISLYRQIFLKFFCKIFIIY